jgi:anti-anti-sigma regulatory factor
MLTYTIEHKRGVEPFVQKTLYLEGKADPSERERLNTIFCDALHSSDHLIVNIRRVEMLDQSFTSLIRAVQKKARHLGKQITSDGEL